MARIDRRTLLSTAGAGALAPLAGPARAQEARKEAEVRFLCFAPSPYTRRRDALRAGLGIASSLQRLAREHTLPIRTVFSDGVPALEDPARAKALLHGAQVLVVGGSTWAQGSSQYLRRFFELTSSESLWGVSATAWATAGGAHTGGERVVEDTQRSLMGMGASVFSLGQKLMVFTTDERTSPPTPGAFDLLDCWFMEQHAKAIAVAAVAKGEPAQAGALAKKLELTHTYYKDFPRDEARMEARYGQLRALLNAAADPKSEEYTRLQRMLSPL